MAEDKEIRYGGDSGAGKQNSFHGPGEYKVYESGMVGDPDLISRLDASGAKFSGQIIEQMSPILSFLLTWVLPIVIFIGIGEYISRKLMKRAGGANSMASEWEKATRRSM